MSKSIIFISGDREQPEARWKRLLKPILNKMLGEADDIPKEVTIKNNQLCINGTAIGDWRLISDFKISDDYDLLEYMYGDNIVRIISFGMKGFEKDFYMIDSISEHRITETGDWERDFTYVYNKYDEE
jgi:hypothetical protein